VCLSKAINSPISKYLLKPLKSITCNLPPPTQEVVLFNALRYTKKLEEVGFTKKQADTALEIGIEVMNENLASKDDLKELGRGFDSVRKEMNFMEQSLRKDMTAMGDRIVIRLSSVIVIVAGLLVAIQKLA